MKQLQDLPTRLTNINIDQTIDDYLKLVKQIPSFIDKKESSIEFLLSIKRDIIKKGPYPGVTLFEAANRIMTDLVILKGVQQLLNGEYPELKNDHYLVEYGHSDQYDHDLTVEGNSQVKLKGEAFNVAESFFPIKKASALKKLRKETSANEKIILIYNKEAVQENYKPKSRQNEYHVRVDIKQMINRIEEL
tara:strand:+ start:7061 stop:7633 length:573 start_codon:yes stop_codon:yes gene_type:complete